jgi:hypothetical protein
MCFSAEASFAGGIIIAAIGVVTIRKVHSPSQIVFVAYYTIDRICCHAKGCNLYFPGNGTGYLAINDSTLSPLYGKIRKTKKILVYTADCRGNVVSILFLLPVIF